MYDLHMDLMMKPENGEPYAHHILEDFDKTWKMTFKRLMFENLLHLNTVCQQVAEIF